MGHSYLHIRHDLKTSLNHIVGYCDILLEDAREYRRTDLSPGIEQLLALAEKLKRLISFHYDQPQDGDSFSSQEVKHAFYIPLTQIISDARRLIVLFRQKAPGFVKDMEQLLAASIQMYDLIEAQVIDHEIPQASAVQEEIPVFDEREYQDNLAGERAVKPASILIVDDSPASQQLLSRHLQALGHTIAIASNGMEALQILQAKPGIEVVILDFVMPQLSGLQVLRTMKETSQTREIPVIMISASQNAANIAQSIKLGAEDYLPKDFDSTILKARIEACLEKRRLHNQQLVFMNALIESQKTLATELAEAARYVVSLLPKPLEGPIQSAIALLPSAKLGGDFASHYWIDQHRLCLYMLDVSGHGIRAALQAVSISNIIKNQGLPDTDFGVPSQVLGSLNTCHFEEGEDGVFFTIWYGVYDTRTSLLTYASGGSPPAVRVHTSGVDLLGTKGLLLGAAKDTPYKEACCTLNRGDKLFLFTDGIYEVSKPNQKIFGLDEFLKLITFQKSSPEDDLENLITTILGMTQNDSFNDDVCLLTLHV